MLGCNDQEDNYANLKCYFHTLHYHLYLLYNPDQVFKMHTPSMKYGCYKVAFKTFTMTTVLL